MKSKLEELFYDTEGLFEKIVPGEEYDKIRADYCKQYDELYSGLNKEQKKILDELFLLSGGLEGEMSVAHFKEGFKAGMLIALEVLN